MEEYDPVGEEHADSIALIQPPSALPNSTTNSEDTTTEPPYEDNVNKEPPRYNLPYPAASTTTTAIPQVESAPTVVYRQQPSPWRPNQISVTEADQIFGWSIACCVICCLCGSPLTLLCFVPAIILSMKVYNIM